MNIKYVECYKTKTGITNSDMFAAPHWYHDESTYAIKQQYKQLSNTNDLATKKPI